MALTAKQLKWLRSEVGGTPPDADLEEAFTRLESVRDVALEIIRSRVNAMLETPLSTTVPGVASVSYAENVKAMERRLVALSRLDDDPTDEPGEDQTGVGGPVFERGPIQLVRSRGR